MTQFNVISPFTQKSICLFDYTPWDEVESDLSLLQQNRANAGALPPYKRSEFLFNLKTLLEKNLNDLASIVTAEIGKTISESKLEIKRAITTVLCSSEEAKRITGKIIPGEAYGASAIKNAFIERRPFGTILAITPFNFPINLALHKIAPALASGNVVYLKPNPQCYLSTKKLVELCYEAGVPQEFLKWGIPEDHEMEKLVSHPKIDLITFTGGLQTAEKIVAKAGIKKLIFELGGNDPLIVLPSANLEQAAQTAINHRFGSAGQRCNAAKRIFLHRDISEQFTQLLLEKTKKLKVGDPANEETFVGPVWSKQAAEKISQMLQTEKENIIWGGTISGCLIQPTILKNISFESEFSKQECFGPIMPLFIFDQAPQLIESLNNDQFGLQAGVFTQNLEDIKLFKDNLDSGGLFFNEGPSFRLDHLPFGGIKKSGFGREGVPAAIEELTYIRTLAISGI